VMKVIRLGSVLRRRNSSAARPTATRSHERSSSTASASAIRSPSSAFSRTWVTATWATLSCLAVQLPLPPMCRYGAPRRTACSYGGRLRRDEADLRHRLELADVARQLQEREQAGALARAEAVAQLLEVAGEEAGRVALALGRLAGERLRLRTCAAERGHERRLELGQVVGERLRTGPDREHHRQARALEPEAAEVGGRGRVPQRG